MNESHCAHEDLKIDLMHWEFSCVCGYRGLLEQLLEDGERDD